MSDEYDVLTVNDEQTVATLTVVETVEYPSASGVSF